MPPVSVMQMLLPTLVNGEYSFDTAALDTDGVKLLQKWVQKYTNRGLPRHLARGESKEEAGLRQSKLLEYYSSRKGGATGHNPLRGGRLKTYTLQIQLGSGTPLHRTGLGWCRHATSRARVRACHVCARARALSLSSLSLTETETEKAEHAQTHTHGARVVLPCHLPCACACMSCLRARSLSLSLSRSLSWVHEPPAERFCASCAVASSRCRYQRILELLKELHKGGQGRYVVCTSRV